MTDDLEFKLTEVEPHYDYSKVGGGYFRLRFGSDKEMPLHLSFVAFLDHRLKQDDNLFEYIRNHHKDNTVSHAICDLYDMGCPVDQWVEEYIEMARVDVDPKMFNALLDFYKYIRNFGETSGSL